MRSLKATTASIELLPLPLLTHRGRLAAACELANDVGLNVYDALFLDLTRTHSARLITADNELARAARMMGL